MKLATADIMKGLDEKTITEVGIPGCVLMENAAQGVVRVIKKQYLKGKKGKIAIFTGGGNNGGDGFVVARHLHNQGNLISVFLLIPPSRLKGDALLNYKIIEKMGVNIFPLFNDSALELQKEKIEGNELLVDAILGTGLKYNVKDHFGRLIDYLNKSQKSIIAVDIPSGLNADTGAIMGTCITAEITVTFGLPKIGLLIHPGAERVGKLYAIDIGIPLSLVEDASINNYLLDLPEIENFIKFKRREDTHKGNYGHLLILAGAVGKTGAAAMVCEAALRSGTGLVTLGIPKSLNQIMEVKTLEAMTHPLEETPDITLSYEAWPEIQRLLTEKKACALGPGISVSDSTKRLVLKVLQNIGIPVVLDADALNCIAGETKILTKLSTPLILTPHPGEMARLTGSDSKTVQNNRIDTARNFARNFGVYLVLKGSRSIIAEPDGTIYINPTGNPGMASGGMGDVLTGMIAGYLSQGYSAGEASKLAVFLHGLLGDRLEKEMGPSGYLAGDMIERIPRTFASIKAESRDFIQWE
ncbi:MAG: NAD(P)H-hydrate dehydratase [Thermodesulfobacteriota bacterium]|nr:NAD(P)H-hydrate dehydratase [Thermodesulfobacteriota bacterium]